MYGSLIVTKYFGPTNHKPSRIKATTSSGLTHWQSWDHSLDVSLNHARAAKRCFEKYLLNEFEKIDGRRAWVALSRDLPKNGGIAHIVQSLTFDKAPSE